MPNRNLEKGYNLDNTPYVACGIVSFNPDLNLLERNIEAIQPQVSDIYVVDNGSNNVIEVKSLILRYPNVHLLENQSNVGIAAALNQACDAAADAGYRWVLTLDQDSVCPRHFVDGLLEAGKECHSVGIIAPIIVDRNVGVVGHCADGVREVRTCITSGSLTNLIAWREIGGFDEKMFIDSVDFDFCFRLRKAGYFVYQTSAVTLDHAIGESRRCRFLFWTFKDLEHSAFRDFYIAQNNVYYPKKNRLWLRFIRGNLRNLKQLLVVLLYENNKRDKVRAICRGWGKGLTL